MDMKFDVIVVGKGISGLSAAIGAASKGANVLVVYDSNINSTMLANKGVFRLFKNTETVYEEILEYGYGISNKELLSEFSWLLKDAPAKISEVFEMELADNVGKKVMGGGTQIIRVLERIAIKLGANFIDGKVIKIVTADNKVSAVNILLYPRMVTIKGKTVIIACGGIGQIYSKTDNSRVINAPGCSLALEAGARVRDMEFIVYHPFACLNQITLYNTIPIYTFFDVAGKKIFSWSGERLQSLEDLINSGLAHKLINEIALAVYKAKVVYFNCDNEKIVMEPCYHSLIGGIDTNNGLETSVSGLFAVGESCGGLHGARRMAGMSMIEGFLFGRKAGENAAEFCSKNPYNLMDYEGNIPDNLKFGHVSIDVIGRIQRLADKALFIEKDEDSLIDCETQLKDVLRGISLKTYSNYVEQSIARTALTVTKASLARKESRGAFFRRDYPKQDPGFCRSVVLEFKDGEVVEQSFVQNKFARINSL